jgi:GTP cyclohydrolase II
MSLKQTTLNGDPAALTIDRAVGELRRGRAVQIFDGAQRAVFGAVESLRPPLLRSLQAADCTLTLLITRERAKASGLATDPAEAMAINFSADATLEELRTLAGISHGSPIDATGIQVSDWPGSSLIATAALKLAKAGRLLPALIGFSTTDASDESVLQVSAADIERHTFFQYGLTRTSQSRVPLADAVESEITLFRDEHGLGEHVAVVIGKLDTNDIVPVRLHSACLTGDLLGSLRCDCGEQLRTAVRRIAALGSGVLLYLDQEGRGIGLANKLRAYAIQDMGLDTVDADRHLGFHDDERNYDVAAALLQELGVSRVRLLTNNPKKIHALVEHGIEVVGRLPLVAAVNSHNERYIKTKRDRAGHLDLAEEQG